ncbi:hypothetical protein HYV11_02525 [Candidatus Dependentiae bacterium]|nr:hypothetical protein [Candidatus Dependentiae bacterium]
MFVKLFFTFFFFSYNLSILSAEFYTRQQLPYDTHGYTSIHQSAENNDWQTLLILCSQFPREIDRVSGFNYQSNRCYGDTPAHRAAYTKSWKSLAILVKIFHANLDTKNKTGRTVRQMISKKDWPLFQKDLQRVSPSLKTSTTTQTMQPTMQDAQTESIIHPSMTITTQTDPQEPYYEETITTTTKRFFNNDNTPTTPPLPRSKQKPLSPTLSPFDSKQSLFPFFPLSYELFAPSRTSNPPPPYQSPLPPPYQSSPKSPWKVTGSSN